MHWPTGPRPVCPCAATGLTEQLLSYPRTPGAGRHRREGKAGSVLCPCFAQPGCDALGESGQVQPLSSFTHLPGLPPGPGCSEPWDFPLAPWAPSLAGLCVPHTLGMVVQTASLPWEQQLSAATSTKALLTLLSTPAHLPGPPFCFLSLCSPVPWGLCRLSPWLCRRAEWGLGSPCGRGYHCVPGSANDSEGLDGGDVPDGHMLSSCRRVPQGMCICPCVPGKLLL